MDSSLKDPEAEATPIAAADPNNLPFGENEAGI